MQRTFVTAAGMCRSSKVVPDRVGALSVAAGSRALALTVYPCLYRAGEQAATVELPDSDLEITTMRSGGAGKPPKNYTGRFIQCMPSGV